MSEANREPKQPTLIKLFRTRKHISFSTLRQRRMGLDFRKLQPGQVFVVDSKTGKVVGVQ